MWDKSVNVNWIGIKFNMVTEEIHASKGQSSLSTCNPYCTKKVIICESLLIGTLVMVFFNPSVDITFFRDEATLLQINSARPQIE